MENSTEKSIDKSKEKSKVYLVSSNDRAEGSRLCLNMLEMPDYNGKTVLIKPNFNTADPAPGSTHTDTLDTLLSAVRSANPSRIIIGERSGPAVTAEVFEKKGIGALCEKYNAEFLNFETMPQEDWVEYRRDDLHWPGGAFRYPRVFNDVDAVVTTCCLKTHAFGGVFSNSLKLAVGITPRGFSPLHDTDDMRKMIAEINLAYKPDFILCDAVEVFTDGGPMEGTRKRADLMLLSSDRIALDAVGLAVLKSLDSNKAIMDTPIFEHEQMARAVELGLGVTSPADIEIVTADEKSAEIAAQLSKILLA